MKRSLLRLGFFVFAARVSAAAEPPANIIVMLADDMGYGDPRCDNPASKIPTPHMDRLAAEGLRFTDAPTPVAVCTPTRYGFLTGRYAWRTRLQTMVLWSEYEEPLIEPARETVARVLQRSGYRTAAVGQWHLGLNFAKPGGGFVRGKSHHLSGAGGTREVDFAPPAQGGLLALGFDTRFLLPGGINLEPHFWLAADAWSKNPPSGARPARPRAPAPPVSKCMKAGWRKAGATRPSTRPSRKRPRLSPR